MFITSDAIVLNRVRYTDNRFLTTLYTQERGSVTFAVRIPKTAKAGIKPLLFQPLNLLTVEWDHHGSDTIRRLRSVNLCEPYSTISSSPAKAAIATFLSEVLTYTLRSEHDGSLFPFLKTSFLYLDRLDNGYANFHIVFLTRLARYMGIAPDPRALLRGRHSRSAASDSSGPLSFFDLMNAELVPAEPNHSYWIGAEETAFLPVLMRLSYSNMHLLRLTRAQRRRILNLIIDYYRLHIPSFPEVRSLPILTEIFDVAG